MTQEENLIAKNRGCFTLWRIFGAEKKLLNPSIVLSIDSSALDFFLLSRLTNFLSKLSGKNGSMKELNFYAWIRKKNVQKIEVVVIKFDLLLLSISSWLAWIYKNRRRYSRFQYFGMFKFVLVQINYNNQVKFRALQKVKQAD